MGFASNASLTTDEREINDTETWNTTTDWNAAKSQSNVVVENGLVRATSTDLISVWEFEEEQDTSTVVDTLRNNTSNINGPSYTTDSKYGGHAMDFDGVDDLCSLSGANFESGGWSISGWVKDRSDTTRHYFCGMNASSSSYVAWVGTGGDGEFYLRDSDVGGDINSATTTDIRDGTWHHFGAVVDPTNDEVRTFVDGSLDYTWTGTHGSYDISNVEWEIGNNGSTNSDRWHDGLLDDLRVFNRTLTDTEMNNVYNDRSV